jgi:ubiquinone/menaquinone biosynthesis C-methylase UbiE
VAEGARVTQSISFDRAADTYDETRGLPDDIAQKQAETLVAEIERAGAARVLEVGIGTGRIARPLAARGVRVSGIDISTRMMARLRAQVEPSFAPVDLLLGDATRLPLAEATVRAVLVVHVLHLVSSWQEALEEIARVLVPGGILLRAREEYPDPNPWREAYAKWIEMERAKGFQRRPRPSDDEIAERLGALGASLRTEVYAQDEDRWTAAGNIEETRNRVGSWTWQFTDEMFSELLAEFELWVKERFGDMDKEYVQPRSFEIDVWTFP